MLNVPGAGRLGLSPDWTSDGTDVTSPHGTSRLTKATYGGDNNIQVNNPYITYAYDGRVTPHATITDPNNDTCVRHNDDLRATPMGFLTEAVSGLTAR